MDSTSGLRINISASNSIDTPLSNDISSKTIVHMGNSSGADSTLESFMSSTAYLTPQMSTSTNAVSNYAMSISGQVEDRLEFEVAHFFVFGSPLGLVLTYRKLAHKTG